MDRIDDTSRESHRRIGTVSFSKPTPFHRRERGHHHNDNGATEYWCGDDYYEIFHYYHSYDIDDISHHFGDILCHDKSTFDGTFTDPTSTIAWLPVATWDATVRIAPK